MKKSIVLLTGWLMAGCATTEGYKATLDQWVGAPETALVQSWGVPDSVYENDSGKYLTYTRSETDYATHMIGGYGSPPMFITDSNTLTCKTTFLIQNKHVASSRFEGNDCVAYMPEDK